MLYELLLTSVFVGGTSYAVSIQQYGWAVVLAYNAWLCGEMYLHSIKSK